MAPFNPSFLKMPRVMVPGQIHAVATLSKPLQGGELTSGSIMYGSQFLSAHCMRRSLFASWTDRVSQTQSTSESSWNSTVKHILVLMVLKIWNHIDQNEELWHDFTPEDIMSLSIMALLFIGEEEEEDCKQKARELVSYYANQHQDTYSTLYADFENLKISNLAGEARSPQHLFNLRSYMEQGRKSIRPGSRCNLS